jgi:hypothetical protein
MKYKKVKGVRANPLQQNKKQMGKIKDGTMP